MSVEVGVGFSDEFDPVEAFGLAASGAARELGESCDLAIVFAGASHLGHGKAILDAVHRELSPANLVGCGAGGVVAPGREVEDGPGAVVWALAAPGARIATHRLMAHRDPEGIEIDGLPPPDEGLDALIVLADPYTFSAEAMLARMNAERPAVPVLGGLASAAAAGSASLFCDGEVVDQGAVACSVEGLPVVPCVSQGATPVGPEMTITACDGNQISGLASTPAIDRLREAIAGLPPEERELVASGLLLGVVIDENQPSYERGDFLVRPIVGADEGEQTIVIGERVRVGQTVRMHVRDPASADEDLRDALGLRAAALGAEGAAGVLLFTCNGRGRHMFAIPNHDVDAVEDALGAPAAGFFCAGEIGPVGGTNFLHGFTATMAVIPRS
jgi:small ligand-binding sensory domain FIST